MNILALPGNLTWTLRFLDVAAAATLFSILMNTSIWYNPKISREPLYFSNWFNAGMLLLSDILNDKGKIELFETLKKIVSITM